MNDDVRVEELRCAAPDLEALRAVFAEHSRPTDDWPDGYGDVRRLAEEFVGQGAPEKAAFVLVAALEDLRRFYVDDDEETDFGWHRSEAKQWQRWANAKALRTILVYADEDVAWRKQILHAVYHLHHGVAPPLEGWFSPDELMPLSSTDAALIRGEESPKRTGWVSPEEAIASAIRAQSSPDVESMRQVVCDEVPAPATDEDIEHLDRLYVFRRVAEHLRTTNAWEAAVTVALEGLVYDAEQVEPRVLERSEEAERAAREQSRVLESVLKEGVARKGPELRRQVLEAVEDNLDVLEDVRKLVGRGDANATTRDVRELVQRYDGAKSDDEKRKLARQLIFQFGDALADERYLGICAEFGWTSLRVERLLTIGRSEEAFATAMGACGGECEGKPSYDLAATARSFLEHGHAARAARLVEPFASENLELAEMWAHALRESGSADSSDAYFSWFEMRPTLETYRSIEEALPDAIWFQLRERIHDYLDRANLHFTLVDIAVEDHNIEALNELIPNLDGVALEHARGRIGSLKESLSSEAAARLDRA